MFVIVGLRLILCQSAQRREKQEKQEATSERSGHSASLFLEFGSIPGSADGSWEEYQGNARRSLHAACYPQI
jgi:hypothetical protein